MTWAPWTAAPGTVSVRRNCLRSLLSAGSPRLIDLAGAPDPFEESISVEALSDLFAVMAFAEHHAFRVFTHRPDRMAALLTSGDFMHRWLESRAHWAKTWPVARRIRRGNINSAMRWPLRNVALGVVIESDDDLLHLSYLVEAPAVLRLVVTEPAVADQVVVNGAALLYVRHGKTLRLARSDQRNAAA